MKGPVIKRIAEEIKDVESVEMIRLRRSGPVVLGEIEIRVPSKMTVKEFNSIKHKINKLSKEKYPEIERINVTAAIDDETQL